MRSNRLELYSHARARVVVTLYIAADIYVNRPRHLHRREIIYLARVPRIRWKSNWVAVRFFPRVFFSPAPVFYWAARERAGMNTT